MGGKVMKNRAERILSLIAAILSFTVLLIDLVIIFGQKVILPIFTRETPENFVFPYLNFIDAVFHVIVFLVCAILVHKSSIRFSKIICLLSVICLPVFGSLFSIANTLVFQFDPSFKVYGNIGTYVNLISSMSNATYILSTCSLLMLAIVTGMLFAKDSIARSSVPKVGNLQNGNSPDTTDENRRLE